MAPMVCGSLYSWLVGQDNPTLTQTQISNLALPYLLPTLVPFIAGLVLFHSGLEDYDEE